MDVPQGPDALTLKELGPTKHGQDAFKALFLNSEVFGIEDINPACPGLRKL